MSVIEDDTILHPDINSNTLLYVTSLNEGHENYTRFFDALLIKRPSHRAFYRDLKAFREQAQLISLLDRAAQDKKLYREVTNVFLSSRFAHPWCRKSPLKKGFWRSEWGMIDGKEKDIETAREEDRLHKLLVPLWVLMRTRMFPGEEIVNRWCREERERREQQKEVIPNASTTQRQSITMELSDQSDRGSFNESDLEAELVEAAQQEHAAAAHAATSVFRLAAAGMFLSQTPRRKLRWLVKKPK